MMCRLIGIGTGKYRHFLKESASARIGIGSYLKNRHRQNLAYALPIPFNNYVSQFSVCHNFLLSVGVYSSNHGVLYTIGTSVTRFKKSVGPSVRPFVTLTKKPTSPSLLTVE